jgi:DNA-binding beta-propeller fold protein YncE
MKRFLWLALVLWSLVIWTGCGDTFRPVIIPNPPAFPDPRAAHTVLVLNDNNTDLDAGRTDPGSVMVVDVSGDTNVSVRDVGLYPVHAVQPSASQVLVVNHSLTGLIGDSLTKVTFSGTTISGTTTISLPPDSAPNFVAAAPSDSLAYVTLPNVVPDPVNFPNFKAVGVVTIATGSVTVLGVESNPVAIAVTPDKSRLYVANHDSNTVSAFNTLDRSPRNNPTLAIPAPRWLVARSDSQRVYVLEDSGTVATIDTTSNAGPDTVIDATIQAPGATFMVYDSLKNRLYLQGNNPSTGDPELVVVDVAPSKPNVLARVPLPAPGIGVAALPDGSRAYAASNGDAQTTTVGTISAVTPSSPRTGLAAYAYDAGSVTGPAPQVGMSLTISGGGDAYDGTFIVTGLSTDNGGNPQFLVANAATADPVSGNRTATGTNFLPQVTVINTAGNAVKTTIAMPAVPAAGPFPAPVCTSTRFPFMMAAGGDSSRVYLASCDGGGVNIINTQNDSYLLSLPAPASSRAPVPPSNQPPAQNPVFLIAGP